MEQPILGRIEQLTFNPHNQKIPVDSGHDKHQDEINRELFKNFDETSKAVNHNFRTLSAAIAALGTVLIGNGLTTFEEIDELTEIATQVIDEKSDSGADKAVELTNVDRDELRKICRPVVEFIQKHYGSPHHRVLIDWNSAVLIQDLAGVGFKTPD